MNKTARAHATAQPKDIYAAVTNSLVAAIEASPGEWTMPWRVSGQTFKLPSNAASKRPYHLIAA